MMKKQNMKKESPFEQAGGHMQGSARKTAVKPSDLSEMMNPANMNYFGATFSFTDL